MWVSPQPRSPPPTTTQFRTLKPEEQRQALRSLELHHQAFLRDSQGLGGFGPEDRLQATRVWLLQQHQQLLQGLEQGKCGPPGVVGGSMRPACGWAVSAKRDVFPG